MRIARRSLTAALIAATFAMPAAAGSPPPAAPTPAGDASPALAKLRQAAADTVTNSPGFTWPANRAELDDAVARKDWLRLRNLVGSIKSFDDLLKLLNWERYQVYTGGGYGMAFLYMTSLWDAGISLEAAGQKRGDAVMLQKGANLKQAAAMWGLYGLAIAQTDGARCADRTAPIEHMRQMATNGQFTFDYARTLPEAQKSLLVGSVMAAEAQLAPLRAPEVALCRGGISDFAAMDDKTPRKEVPAPPGQLGRMVEVQLDPKKLPPPFAAQAGWPAAIAASRGKLAPMLKSMLGLPA